MRGSIKKRGNAWSIVVDLQPDPTTGERRQKRFSGYKTKKDAERALNDFASSVQSGTFVAASKQTLKDFLLEEWLPAKRTAIKPTSAAGYERNINFYIVPHIGGLPLAKLQAGTLNKLYTQLIEGGGGGGRALSSTTVRNVHRVLHMALADAVKWGKLVVNPAAHAHQPRKAEPKLNVWNGEQLNGFLLGVESDRLFPALRLAATTGMRRGELLGLRWCDLDAEQRSIRVARNRTVANKTVNVGSPKTASGVRTVSLDATTMIYLSRLRARTAQERLALGIGWDDDAYLFVHADQTPIHPTHFSHRFKALVDTSGLPATRFHDIRHAYATVALNAGVPVKVVSQRLGHANVTITLQTYAHVMPGDDQHAAQKVADAIFGS